MKVVASNIFDFTTWYKFGYKFVPHENIIDLADDKVSGEDLLKKTGFFEEEYEVFYLEIPESLLLPNQSLFLSLHDVVNLIPLTEKGGKLLLSKIPDFKIRNSIAPEIGSKLIEERNKYLAISGGLRLLETFGLQSDSTIEKFQALFLVSLQKYFKDLNAEQDSVLDNILFYERSKPYPLTDVGFLFDVGGIARERFNLKDEDFRNKAFLQENEEQKYELVEEVLALSKFLQNNQTDGVWSAFLESYKNNNWLKKLSSDLSMVGGCDEINNLLVLAFYLKFRYLIRNTANLEEGQFEKRARQFLIKVPVEAKIALFLVGMFFGALKFKGLFYKSKPLKIAKIKIVESIKSPPRISGTFNWVQKIAGGSPKPSAQKPLENMPLKPSFLAESSSTSNSSDGDTSSDDKVWKLIDEAAFKYSKKQKELVQKFYSEAFTKKGSLFKDSPNIFLEKLKNWKNKSRATKPESQLTDEIIEEINEILKSNLN